MRLKSFHGSTVSEAMRQVREALGDNAIIVSTREDDAGGVRVTAAIEDMPAAPKATPAYVPVDGSQAIEKIAEALTRQNVPTHLAETLLATATQCASDDPLLGLGAAFDMHFKFSPLSEVMPAMLVGPPGAGKTLCTAKLATRMTLAKRAPVVISTDLDRAGGIEQLAAFTRLLKINLVEIEDWNALRDAVAMHKNNPVFIDTAGGNPYDPEQREMLRDYIAAIGEATLVIPGGMDAGEAIELAQEFRNLGVTRLMLTRLDCVKRIGSLLRIAHECQLPLANFSASPKVTEAPQPFNPVVLARLVLKPMANQSHHQTSSPKSAFGGAS